MVFIGFRCCLSCSSLGLFGFLRVFSLYFSILLVGFVILTVCALRLEGKPQILRLISWLTQILVDKKEVACDRSC